MAKPLKTSGWFPASQREQMNREIARYLKADDVVERTLGAADTARQVGNLLIFGAVGVGFLYFYRKQEERKKREASQGDVKAT